MEFVCLAAGKGSRFLPLSKYIHKCMIPFYGIPFLEYSLIHLPKDSEVYIIVNCFSEQIINYFGNNYKGIKIKYFRQETLNGIGGALFEFNKKIKPDNNIVIWQSDQLIYGDMFDGICNKKGNTITYNRNQEIGLWNLEPETLKSLKDFKTSREFKPLPILYKKFKINKNKTKHKRIELRFDTWEKTQKICKRIKNEKFCI